VILSSLKSICTALSQIEKNKAWYLEDGYMDPIKEKVVRQMVNHNFVGIFVLLLFLWLMLCYSRRLLGSNLNNYIKIRIEISISKKAPQIVFELH
jgi:hypothetical protein